MNPRKNSLTTANGWCVSGAYPHDHNAVTPLYRLSVYRLLYPPKVSMPAAPPYVKTQRAEGDGLLFPIENRYDTLREDKPRLPEVEVYCLEHGYSQWHGRNTMRFVMSRAARRRGYTNAEYERRVRRYDEMMRLRREAAAKRAHDEIRRNTIPGLFN